MIEIQVQPNQELKTELEDFNYDYWALGHIHIPSRDNSNIVYPGTIQGRNTKETGAHGFKHIIVENNKIVSNSLIAMVKDTSLAANITVTEMFMATQRIVARTYEPLALYIEVGLIYLLFCTVLTRLQRIGERRLGAYGG